MLKNSDNESKYILKLVTFLCLLTPLTMASEIDRDHFTYPRKIENFVGLELNVLNSKITLTSQSGEVFRFDKVIADKKFGESKSPLLSISNNHNFMYLEATGPVQTLIYDNQGGSLYPQWLKLTGAIELDSLSKGLMPFREKTEFGWFNHRKQLTCAVLVMNSTNEWIYLETKTILGVDVSEASFTNPRICPFISKNLWTQRGQSDPYLEKARISIKYGEIPSAILDWVSKSSLNPALLVMALDIVLAQPPTRIN